MDPTQARVRDAFFEDVEELARLRYSPALHRDRVRDAASGAVRYLVLDVADRLVGFAVLVLSQPRGWPRVRHMPQALDVFVRADLRGQGLGTRILRAAEARTVEQGGRELWLGVDPEENAPALQLYLRLGYEQIDPESVLERWSFTDSGGSLHQGEDRTVYLRRKLSS